jgi:hypothetical protein
MSYPVLAVPEINGKQLLLTQEASELESPYNPDPEAKPVALSAHHAEVERTSVKLGKLAEIMETVKQVKYLITFFWTGYNILSDQLDLSDMYILVVMLFLTYITAQKVELIKKASLTRSLETIGHAIGSLVYLGLAMILVTFIICMNMFWDETDMLSERPKISEPELQ